MVWKGVDFFPHNLRIPFTRYMWMFLMGSLVLNLLAIGIVATRGLNFSIDFTGGTLMEITTKDGAADLAELRSKLGNIGIGTPQIQAFGDGTGIMIRIQQQEGGDKAQVEAVSKVKAVLGDGVEYRRTESAGPTVSGEIARTGVIAVLVSMLGIAAYVWFRFEWQFAVGATLSLIHDVLMTLGFFAVTGLEFDNNCIAALLTIVGYSINDSVVVYDRVRENLRKYKKMAIAELLDRSINETLSRTVLTAGGVILALLALLSFGGEVIRSFITAMLFGVITGTYSSIFVASTALLMIGVKRDWSGTGGGAEAGTAVGRP